MKSEVGHMLNLMFDAVILGQEYSIVADDSWPLHYNAADYEGTWTSLALYSISGRVDDIRALPNHVFQPTPALDACPYIKSLLDEMKFEKESVRFLRLKGGSSIKIHRDRGLSYEHDCFRLHVPILTSDEVQFIVGGINIEMRAGECWYANFDLPHSVENLGGTDRVHLVIDGKRNQWADDLFSKSGYDITRKLPSLHSKETKEAIREELIRMGGTVALQLIQKLDDE